MKYDIENVTEEDMAWDEYSVMEGMTVYTVCVEDTGGHAYDDKGSEIEGTKFNELVASVMKFRELE